MLTKIKYVDDGRDGTEGSSIEFVVSFESVEGDLKRNGQTRRRGCRRVFHLDADKLSRMEKRDDRESQSRRIDTGLGRSATGSRVGRQESDRQKIPRGKKEGQD